MTVTVAQLGARMHYAVPRLLHHRGILSQLYTDLCATTGGLQRVAQVSAYFGISGARRLLDRVPAGVPPEHITAFGWFGLDYALRRMSARNRDEMVSVHLWAGREFCRRVVERRQDWGEVIYGFNSAMLEMLAAAKGTGPLTVVEQTIPPKRFQDDILSEERERFPAWEGTAEPGCCVADFIAREYEEWSLADMIVCGSDFVREAVARVGGPVAKCVVVPYGGNFGVFTNRSPRQDTPLRALFMGAASLRKGTPYLLEAARILGPSVRIRAVGPILVSDLAARDLRQYIELVGPVPRSEAYSHYMWADVFVFPSLCEGSATVCYEALAAGLPIITTVNAGSVVRNGVEGFLVPPRDPEALADKLRTLATDEELRASMSRNAIRRSCEFSLDMYGTRLIRALTCRAAAPPTGRADTHPHAT